MTQRSFAAGSEFPPLDKDVLRIYSMRFCPFAQRTRMVLAHKEIPNTLGLVPILEKNDRIVYDSTICNDYLDEVYPQKKLTPSDPYTKARHRMIGEHFNKVVSAIFEIYRSEENSTEQFMKALDTIEGLLNQDYFGGREVAMIDFHLWPWIEQFGMLSVLSGGEVFPKDRFPKLAAYVELMSQQPAVKATVLDDASHLRFIKSFLADDTDYDFDL